MKKFSKDQLNIPIRLMDAYAGGFNNPQFVLDGHPG
jgi:hypothetical protein